MPEPKFEHRTGTIFALKPIRLANGDVLLPANRESEHPDPKRGWTSLFYRSTSADGGTTWAPLEKTALDNPSSRSDFVALVIACNPAGEKRASVSLLLSRDGGETWPIRRDIETGPGPYGYTAVLRTRDGKIHVAYDCDRRVIKHAIVDEAWFEEPARMLDYTRP